LTSNPGKSTWWDKFIPHIGDEPYWKWTRDQVIEAFCKIKGIQNDGICPQCGDAQRITVKEGDQSWQMWCLCSLTTKIASNAARHREDQSMFVPARLKDFNTAPIDHHENTTLKAAYIEAKNFMLDPQSWLILSGSKGLGKTHLLRAIAGSYGIGIALFVTGDDLADKIMELTGSRDHEDTLSAYIRFLQHVPILLIDDVSTKRQKTDGIKLPYILDKIKSVIDFRYRNRIEYPLALTTNESQQALRTDEWGILGDRIADDVNIFVPMVGQSYRQSEFRRGEKQPCQ
jgi:DNA replication protein DnaC